MNARAWLILFLLAGCGDDSAVVPDAGGRGDSGMMMRADAGRSDAGGETPDSGAPDGGSVDAGGCALGACPPVADLDRDVVETRLTLDLSTSAGTADVRVAPSATSSGLSFEVGDLTIASVGALDGDTVTPLMFAVDEGRLDIGVAPGTEEIVVRIAYTFADHDAFDGWMPESGLSFLWPTFCGNLYPCHSNPADGSTFEMNVTGAPAGAELVYPETIPESAPTYMPALAVGDYTYERIGETTAGTEVGMWFLPGERDTMRMGAANLDDYFDYLEETYGAYAFGARVGSVSAPWGPGAYGGMEHHPYWHVATDALNAEEVHAHEAAHGWFGNGVRIECWEDFVLSEGLASYLAARAIEAADGAAAGTALWADYQGQLERAVMRGDTLALPDSTCNEIDILTHPLWSNIPYMKGAFFMRAVEIAVGRAELDAALRAFYEANVGRAARMQDLLDAIQADTGFDPSTLADDWLRTLGIPE
jgi:aminopeptidase N